jgi:hypothetical protein
LISDLYTSASQQISAGALNSLTVEKNVERRILFEQKKKNVERIENLEQRVGCFDMLCDVEVALFDCSI